MTLEEVFATHSWILLVSVLWFGLCSDTHVLVFRCCFLIGRLGDLCFSLVLPLLHVCGSNQGCHLRVCFFSLIDQHGHTHKIFF